MIFWTNNRFCLCLDIIIYSKQIFLNRTKSYKSSIVQVPHFSSSLCLPLHFTKEKKRSGIIIPGICIGISHEQWCHPSCVLFKQKKCDVAREIRPSSSYYPLNLQSWEWWIVFYSFCIRGQSSRIFFTIANWNMVGRSSMGHANGKGMQNRSRINWSVSFNIRSSTHRQRRGLMVRFLMGFCLRDKWSVISKCVYFLKTLMVHLIRICT